MGEFLLCIVLALAVLIGAFVIWLRIEPEEVTACEAGFRLIEHSSGADCIPDGEARIISMSGTQPSR
ncbi:MAG: hypothetical protein AAF490_25020 [Chloroflexota bacterium]